MLQFISLALLAQPKQSAAMVNFLGDNLVLPVNETFHLGFDTVTKESVAAFYAEANQLEYQPLVKLLQEYRVKNSLSDWLYYQLIRKAANAISPKQQNYPRYTLYKWFLLGKSGYDAVVRIIDKNRLLFYVRSDDNVYNIPFQVSGGKQYVCLNYHDYENIDLETEKFFQDNFHIPGALNSFSYKVTRMPDSKAGAALEKDLRFEYHNKTYDFKVSLNPNVKDIFTNYPVVDFATFFNIPMSGDAYHSLIPELRAVVDKMDQKKGVDYLMHFTRYAFAFEKDMGNFGKEKRLAPEETLFYEYSDCEDRAALLFYLVKEIYNLPMITLVYPEHVTIAISFSKPFGKTIRYNGNSYTVCEPTSQAQDLKMGQLPPALRKASYDIVYEYLPGIN